MLAITSPVRLGSTSMACMFSVTCEVRDAPVMTVLTLGFFRHQAKAICAKVQPRALAIGTSCLTFPILTCVSELLRAPLAGAPVKRLALIDDVGHGADGFLDRGVAVRPVAEHQIDVIHLQAGQRRIQPFDNVLARQALVVDSLAARLCQGFF